jgi:hypothetical protein
MTPEPPNRFNMDTHTMTNNKEEHTPQPENERLTVAEALAHLNRKAKREMESVGLDSSYLDDPSATIESIVEEYRKEFLLATDKLGEEGMQLYCSRCADDDSFYDWLRTALTRTAHMERARVVELIKNISDFSPRAHNTNEEYLAYEQAVDDLLTALDTEAGNQQ